MLQIFLQLFNYTAFCFQASADDIKKICEIYDWHGKGQLDLFYLGDIMYALGFNITKKICMANGQQEEEEKKFASFDDVVTMVNAALKTPENHGNYHDYIELCKLYDKNENGTMMLAELENILSNLGRIWIFIIKVGIKNYFKSFLQSEKDFTCNKWF